MRSGEVRRSGSEGDCAADGAPYNGFVPAARSGLTGKRGMPGDMGNLDGDGGSMPMGLSLSFANLTVLRWWTAACSFSSVRGGTACVVGGTSSEVLSVNKANRCTLPALATRLDLPFHHQTSFLHWCAVLVVAQVVIMHHFIITIYGAVAYAYAQGLLEAYGEGGRGADDDQEDGQKRATVQAMRFELLYPESDALGSCGSWRRDDGGGDRRDEIGAIADAGYYCCSASRHAGFRCSTIR